MKMSETLLIQVADKALSHESLVDRLYEALQAADDTMPKVTRDYVTLLYEEISLEAVKLAAPPTEKELAAKHPAICDSCED